MRRVAFLFPGQGAQIPGMGRALHDESEAARGVFERADAALGTELSRACFEGPPERLGMTETTQPAVLTVSVAALRALEAGGVTADAVAGHSLGEYAAHVAAGTIGFEDAVRTVRERGRFMQEAVPVGQGAMAAILGLDLAAVAEVCSSAGQGGVVAPANLNGPAQIVIAGESAAVERARTMALDAGARRAIALDVSAPFHCELMRPAAERLEAVLERLELASPTIPVYANVTASPVSDAAHARRALVSQVASPVRWHESMARMLDDGFETFVEVGPGTVLAGLMRGIRRGIVVRPAGTPEQVGRVIDELGGG